MRIEGVERGRVTVNINGGCCMVNLTTPLLTFRRERRGGRCLRLVTILHGVENRGREKDDPRNFVKSFSSLLPPLIILFSPRSF